MIKDLVDHIAILVDDLEIAEEWYTEQLKAEISYKDYKYVRLKVHNTNIALINRQYYDYAHIGILVENKEDLPENGKVVHHRDGTIGCYVKDPFGNYLEYIWYSKDQKKIFTDD